MSELKGRILQVCYGIRSELGASIFAPIDVSTIRNGIESGFGREYQRGEITNALTILVNDGYFTSSHRDKHGRVTHVTDLTEKGRSEAESLNGSTS